MTIPKALRSSLTVSLIFLVYTLISFGFYLERTLNGDINYHILAAEKFGVPPSIKARGIVEPLYHGPVHSGWDGQFYFYMSNDILGRRDIPAHIDAPSYRYQRIGLSLYANITTKLLGRSWVSPTAYFVSYLALILAATAAGAYLFSKIGIPPAFILLWSLSVGSQITLFNALPDAAADAFLILALTALHLRRYLLSAIPFMFAGLSREVYVLFPSFVLLLLLFNQVRDLITARVIDPRRWIERAWCWRNYYVLALPGLVAVLWHIYVVRHFGIAPSDQSHGILGAPLAAWGKYFLAGLQGSHPMAGAWTSYAEAACLVLFLVVLGLACWTAARALINRDTTVFPETRGVAVAAIAFALLYACFGPVVMMYYTGYLKAIAVFFFLIPFLLPPSAISPLARNLSYALLFAGFLFTTYYNMRVRILPYNGVEDQYTKMSSLNDTRPLECFGEYEAAVHVKDVRIMNNGVLGNLFGKGGRVVVTLDLTNTSHHDFVSSNNIGGVFMSYLWMDAVGNVKEDGVRTAIPQGLKVGETAEFQVISPLPAKGKGDVFMRLSPVQEGCAWFFVANPKITQSADIQIRN